MNNDMSHMEGSFNAANPSQTDTLKPAPHMDAPTAVSPGGGMKASNTDKAMSAPIVASQPQPVADAASPGNGMSYAVKEEAQQYNEAFENSADEGPSDGRGMNDEGGMGHGKMNSEKTSSKVHDQMNTEDAAYKEAKEGMNSNIAPLANMAPVAPVV